MCSPASGYCELRGWKDEHLIHQQEYNGMPAEAMNETRDTREFGRRKFLLSERENRQSK